MSTCYCITNYDIFEKLCKLLTSYNIGFTCELEDTERIYDSTCRLEKLWYDLLDYGNPRSECLNHWPLVVLEVNFKEKHCVHFHVSPKYTIDLIRLNMVYGCTFYEDDCSTHYHIMDVKSEEHELSNALKAQIHDSLTINKYIVQKSFSNCLKIVDLFVKYGFTHRKTGSIYSGILLSRDSFIAVANLQWQDSDDLNRPVNFNLYAGPTIREVYISRNCSDSALRDLRHFGYLVDIEDVEEIDKYLCALLSKPFFNIGFENFPPTNEWNNRSFDDVAAKLEEEFRKIVEESC